MTLLVKGTAAGGKFEGAFEVMHLKDKGMKGGMIALIVILVVVVVCCCCIALILVGVLIYCKKKKSSGGAPMNSAP